MERLPHIAGGSGGAMKYRPKQCPICVNRGFYQHPVGIHKFKGLTLMTKLICERPDYYREEFNGETNTECRWFEQSDEG